jgi:phage-related protein
MNKNSCLIYEGIYFSLEWYYDKRGNSVAYEYFLETSNEQKRKFLILVKKIGDYGKIFDKTKFRYEGDGIYVFKPQPDRYFCFFTKGKRIIVTNAFEKKSDKMPAKEKDKAIVLKTEYNNRNL